MSPEAASAAPELELVRGPRAIGGGRRRFLDLLLLTATTNFRKAFFGTALGYAWSLLRPLLLFGVLLVVFTRIIRIGSGIENYPIFLLFNIVFFSFFQETTNIATTSVMAQEGVVRKTQFPRLVIPLSIVLTGLFNLGMNLIAVLAFMLAFGVGPMWSWLLFPLVLLPLMVVLTASISTLLSAMYVRRRDVGIIWSVMSMALFYGSAVLIPLTYATGLVRDLMLLNPLVPLFVQAHKWMIDPDAPGVLELADGWWHLLPAALIFVGVAVWSVWYFNREAPRIAEEL
jgi:ABC-2 type transport system permease protein